MQHHLVHRRVRALVTTAMALAAMLCPASLARADVEPNNVISQAEGPIAGGTPINGTLGTPDDVDWYVFYAASQQQIHLTATNLTNSESSCFEATLSDTTGSSSLPNDYTTPIGTNRFFISVDMHNSYSCSVGTVNYRLEVDPGSAIVTGPPLDRTLTPTGEPNETPGQAIGPLSANVNYTGANDTANDQDWFYMYIPSGAHQLQVEVTSPDCSSLVNLYDTPSDNSIAEASGNTSSYGYINQTVTGPAQYYLRAGPGRDSCLSEHWQFRITTPDAVTTTNPFTAPAPTPTPPASNKNSRKSYGTDVSLRRRGPRYSGRVSSSRLGCKVGRRVVLRRSGSGTRSFGSTTSRSDGTYTIQRSSRLHGHVYAVAAKRVSSTVVCRDGRSTQIRG